jgi:hypothetical protein
LETNDLRPSRQIAVGLSDFFVFVFAFALAALALAVADFEERAFEDPDFVDRLVERDEDAFGLELDVLDDEPVVALEPVLPLWLPVVDFVPPLDPEAGATGVAGVDRTVTGADGPVGAWLAEPDPLLEEPEPPVERWCAETDPEEESPEASPVVAGEAAASAAAAVAPPLAARSAGVSELPEASAPDDATVEPAATWWTVVILAPDGAIASSAPPEPAPERAVNRARPAMVMIAPAIRTGRREWRGSIMSGGSSVMAVGDAGRRDDLRTGRRPPSPFMTRKRDVNDADALFTGSRRVGTQ